MIKISIRNNLFPLDFCKVIYYDEYMSLDDPQN